MSKTAFLFTFFSIYLEGAHYGTHSHSDPVGVQRSQRCYRRNQNAGNYSWLFVYKWWRKRNEHWWLLQGRFAIEWRKIKAKKQEGFQWKLNIKCNLFSWTRTAVVVISCRVVLTGVLFLWRTKTWYFLVPYWRNDFRYLLGHKTLCLQHLSRHMFAPTPPSRKYRNRVGEKEIVWKNTTPLNDMPRTMININSQIISKQEEEYQARVI